MASFFFTALSDCAEQRDTGSPHIELGSSDIELMFEGGALLTEQTVGLRFPGVTIPQGNTIDTAYIQFQVDEADSGSIQIRIWGEDVDSSAVWATTTNNVSDRVRTTASVDWTPAAWGTIGTRGVDQRTPSLVTIVQEIVDRAGWASGNPMAFIFDGLTAGSGTDHRVAVNAVSPTGPELVVTWSAPVAGKLQRPAALMHTMLPRIMRETW